MLYQADQEDLGHDRPSEPFGVSSKLKEKSRKNSWCHAFWDLYLETFSPLLLVLPIMFVQIGVVRGSILMSIMLVIQTICAKLNFESTRLQRENLHLARNEDFETLISAPRVDNSMLIAIFAKMYPVVLVLNSSFAIMIFSIAVD